MKEMLTKRKDVYVFNMIKYIMDTVEIDFPTYDDLIERYEKQKLTF